MNLYQINEEYQKVLADAYAEAEANNGEFTPDLDEALDNLSLQMEIKVDNTLRYIKNLQGEADMVKAEASNLSARASATQKKADWLKSYLASFLGEGNAFKNDNHIVSWRKSEAVSVAPEAVAMLADEYKWTTVKVDADKAALKKALKAGTEISGVALVVKQNIQVK